MIGLADKKILVVGLGKTGNSVCRYLHAHDIAFDVVDDRPEPPNLKALVELVPELKVNSDFKASLFCQYDVLIVSPGVAVSTPAIAAAATAGCEIIGDVELFARAVNVPVIAVTGSNGKSTVVAWLASVLKQTSINAVLCGNIGEPVLTAINPLAELYIVELSSFQLETTVSLKPLSATVLNVSEDHMDRYESLEHYAATKRRIYDGSSYAVVNSEDTRTQLVEQPAPSAIRILQFGPRHSHQNYFGINTVDGVECLATPDTHVLDTKDLPLPGSHNISNALAVLALLHPLAIDINAIRTGLLSFRGLPHRTQLVTEKNSVRWYNDSKGTNVDASRRAIEAMGCPVILIAGGLGKNADFNELRTAVQQHVKSLILIGQDAPLIEHALKDVADVVRATDMRQAVEIAATLAVPGDAVLLSPACSSFDMFDSFEQRGEVFAREVLRVAA